MAIDLSGNSAMLDVGEFKGGPQTADSTSDDFAVITAGTTGRLTRYINVSADCTLVCKNKAGTNVSFELAKGTHPIRTNHVVSVSAGTVVGFY